MSKNKHPTNKAERLRIEQKKKVRRARRFQLQRPSEGDEDATLET
jgi:hypothetical protein